nr:hypothetical protein [Streptacidiphilus albus]
MIDYLGRPCPAWCAGRHGAEPPWQDVLYHESEPVVLDVLVDPVEVQCISGLIQFPDAADPRHRNVTAWSWVVTSVGLRQPSDVLAYADMLTGYADRLRELAGELATAQAEDHAARSERT